MSWSNKVAPQEQDQRTYENDAQARRVTLVDSDGDVNDVQYPLSANGDSIYEKDIKTSLDDIGTFTGTISRLFNNLDDSITCSTADNPKYFEFYLERPVATGGVGIVSSSGTFSNVKVILKDRQGNTLAENDDSADNTDRDAYMYPVISSNFCCVRIEFHTTDAIDVSFLRIRKDLAVDARIKAIKPDGTETEVQATAGGNLKVSVEEIGEADPTAGYGINNVDDDANDATPNYYGFEDKDGKYYILKEDKSSNPAVYTYTKGDSGYATAWTNRATESYDTFGNTF